MRWSLAQLGLLAFSLCMPALTPAADPLHRVIDRHIRDAAGGPVAPTASDAEFLRRVTLDLAGRVPTIEETRAFLGSTGATKRAQVVDRLLASQDYARWMQEFVSVWVLERRNETSISQPDWIRYLQESLAADRPWSQIVGELLFVPSKEPEYPAAAKFMLVAGRKGNAHQITQDVARLFLGRDIMCAQCHDHPSVESYTQRDYFGLYSYVQEKPSQARSEFESVFEPGQQSTGPRLPGRSEREVPEFEPAQEAEAAAYRPRLMLSADLPHPENRLFVRTCVNRFWYLMMGRGLVHPLDADHPDNPPSHPELLEALQNGGVADALRIKPLLRQIALSDAYQRAGAWSGLTEGEGVPEDRYRVAIPKPLSPEQLAWSLLVATGNRERMEKTPASEPKFNWYDYINGLSERLPANTAETLDLFGRVLGAPEGENQDQFNPAMGHALFLMHEPLVLDWLEVRPGSLMERVLASQDTTVQIQEIYLSVLSREPDDQEQREAIEYLQANQENHARALVDLVWAHLAAAEFRLNH